MQTLQNNTSRGQPSISASRKPSTPSLGKASPDTYHSYLRQPLPKMPSLDPVAHGAGLPPTEKSESLRNSMMLREKDRPVQKAEIGWSALEETRQSSPNRSDLDGRDRKGDHDHIQAILRSTTGGHNPPPAQRSKSMQVSTENWYDEAQRAAEKEIDQSPFQMIDIDLDNARAIVTGQRRDRARKSQRRLEAGEIKRMKNINCCRCHTWSGFPDGKCVDEYCQHKCCEICLLIGT